MGLCDECKLNEAVYTVSVVMGEEMRIRHLCPDCMDRMNQQFHTGNIKNILSSLLSAIGDTISDGEHSDDDENETADPRNDVVCPRCGTSLSMLLKQGRLGCPACYEAFDEQLQPMLMQIHGRTVHAGRAPLATREAQLQRNRQEELTRRMVQAVAEEDFETAAILRDQLRALSQGGEQA